MDIAERTALLESIAVELQKILRQKNSKHGGQDDEIELVQNRIRTIVELYDQAVGDYKKLRGYDGNGRIRVDKIAALTAFFILKIQPFCSKRKIGDRVGYASTGFAALANEAFAVHVAQAFLGIKRFDGNLYPVIVDIFSRARSLIHDENMDVTNATLTAFETFGVLAFDQLHCRIGDSKVAYED